MFTIKTAERYPDTLKCACAKPSHLLVEVVRDRASVDIDIIVCRVCSASAFGECRHAPDTVAMHVAKQDAVERVNGLKTNICQ